MVSRASVPNYRNFLPLVTITGVKALFATLIFLLPGKTAAPWNLYGARTLISGVYLFSAWDSEYYHWIASAWYPSRLGPLWAYFPVYPLMIRTLGFTGIDLWVAGIIIANVAGLGSIFVFQVVATRYLDSTGSVFAAILYFLLPPVFVFTTVVYSESVFLLFSLLTWYAHLKGNELSAAMFACLTVLTRSYGLLILVPIAYDVLTHRKFREAAVYALPILTLAGWLLYAFEMTGVFFAPLVAESAWNTTKVIQLQTIFVRVLNGDVGALLSVPPYYWVVLSIGAGFLAVFVFLTIRVSELNRALATYSLLFLLSFGVATVLFIPTFASISRYLSLAFSSGIGLHMNRSLRFLLIASVLAVIDLLAWWLFLFSTAFH